jgi:hypothetical protein
MSMSLRPANGLTQDQRPPLTIAALVRLAVISVIVFCILASFGYAAGRHLTGQADTTVREGIPTDLRRPSEQQPQPRQRQGRNVNERESYVAV